MRQGRFITTAAAAAAVLAIGPASALATPGSFTDNTIADFGAGTHDAAISVVDPGLRLTRSMMTEEFTGGLPANLVANPTNAAVVSGGALTVDGGNVTENRQYTTGQVLEFRAAFSGQDFQVAGLADSLNDGPWAVFSTGDTSQGQGFGVSTRSAALGMPTFQEITIPGFNPAIQHTYRIEWSGTTVNYFVDNGPQPVATGTIANGSQLRPAVSDFTPADGGAVTVDSVGLSLFSATGGFDSKVRDAGAGRVTWGALTAVADTPASTGVAFATRTGQTLNAGDATWSAYQPVGPGGAVLSPSARYIQYRATLNTSDNRITPSLQNVKVDYDLDTTPIGGGQTGGTGGTSQQGGGSSTQPADTTKPKVTLVAKSLKASKKGTVSFTVGCPATEQSCKITLTLKNGTKTVASKTVNVKGGKSKAVTLTLNKATKSLLKKRGSLKVSAVTTATDVAGNTRTTTKAMTLRRAAR
jgi:hypothetical protein